MNIKQALSGAKPILLDGAMGTELQRKGFKTELPLWSAKALIEAPDLVKSIHQDYIKAGAQIITTNTFRTQSSVFSKVGMENKADYYTRMACKLAEDAKDNNPAIFIAGSMGPLEDCYKPELVEDDKTLHKIHLQHAKALIDGGVDFLIIETMNTIREAKITTEIAHDLGKDFMVGFVCNEKGLLSGESLNEAISDISPLNPLAFNINCCSLKTIDLHLKSIVKSTDVAIGAYANGIGGPSDDCGWQFDEDMNVDLFADYAEKWLPNLRIIGGCCGTTPEYIARLRKLIDDKYK